jgi:hypothetical protein
MLELLPLEELLIVENLLADDDDAVLRRLNPLPKLPDDVACVNDVESCIEATNSPPSLSLSLSLSLSVHTHTHTSTNVV